MWTKHAVCIGLSATNWAEWYKLSQNMQFILNIWADKQTAKTDKLFIAIII